jgi:hypothetical protein
MEVGNCIRGMVHKLCVRDPLIVRLVIAPPSYQVAEPLSSCLRVEDSLDLILRLGLVFKVNCFGWWRLYAVHFVSLPEQEPVDREDRVECFVARG